MWLQHLSIYISACSSSKDSELIWARYKKRIKRSALWTLCWQFWELKISVFLVLNKIHALWTCVIITEFAQHLDIWTRTISLHLVFVNITDPGLGLKSCKLKCCLWITLVLFMIAQTNWKYTDLQNLILCCLTSFIQQLTGCCCCL